MADKINFYSVSGKYGCFSNFAPYPIKLQRQRWPTSEHYFQAQKFSGTKHEELVRKAKSPMIAARMGRDRKRPMAQNWGAIKDQIMRDAVLAKFTQHPDIQKILLATGNAELIEHTANDSYWADGGDGSGKNRLGIILMETREILRRG